MKIERTATFKRNFKSFKKKTYDMSKLEIILNHLVNDDKEVLKNKYKYHALKGDLKDFRELHIESDWLLVYKVEKKN